MFYRRKTVVSRIFGPFYNGKTTVYNRLQPFTPLFEKSFSESTFLVVRLIYDLENTRNVDSERL